MDHDPFQPHAHEPNPDPPTADPSFEVLLPNGRIHIIHPQDLAQLPYTTVDNCYIVSTGHGTSGPFTFGGVTLLHLITTLMGDSPWNEVEVASADGFGNRIYRAEMETAVHERPILLAYRCNNQPLTRRQGLVRLIVPTETKDALRQVKWVGHLVIHLRE